MPDGNEVKPQGDEKNNTNKFLACTSLAMVMVTTVMVGLTCQSNIRTGKLFIGQNKPLIDVTPISITPGISEVSKKEANMATTLFSVANYSGFVAYNIVIDIKYGKKNNWISEWLKAEDDNKKEKKGVVINKIFISTPKAPTPESFIPELKPGDKGASKHIGSFDLEGTVCSAGYDGYPVFVRVTWENKKGHVFDEIHKYTLLCTKKDLGRSFTFIPEGIESKKD